MPVSQFGHSKGGINLTNYRLLNEKQAANPTHVYRTTFAHIQETQTQLAHGSHEFEVSAHLREEADELQAASSKLVETDLSAVERALKAKIAHTEQLKNTLHSVLVDTVNEIELCVQLKANLVGRLQAIEKKAELNESRLNVRQVRPTREKTMDDVEIVLMKQQGLIGTFADKVKRSIQHLDHEVDQLEQCRMKLDADLKDKIEAIEVDTKVLHISPNGDKGEAASLKAKADVVLKTPHTWASSTDDNMKKARQWIASSLKLRKAIRHSVHDSRSMEHEVNRHLNNKMLTKITHTRGLKDNLEQQLEKVKEEAARAEAERLSLAAAMEAKRGPLAQAKERFQARKARPDREQVQDDVEAALATEIAHLNAVTTQLSSKLNNVDKEIASLDLAAATIADNIRDKETAIQLDEKVCWLDGRVNISIPPPSSVGSNGSVLSAAKTATLSRIHDLEKELTLARQEREALEKAVEEMRT